MYAEFFKKNIKYGRVLSKVLVRGVDLCKIKSSKLELQRIEVFDSVK